MGILVILLDILIELLDTQVVHLILMDLLVNVELVVVVLVDLGFLIGVKICH